MSDGDKPFRTAIEQAVFAPRHELVQEACVPVFAEIAGRAGATLLGLRFVGSLPEGLELAGDALKTIKTTAATQVTLDITLSTAKIAFQPGLIIDLPDFFALGATSLTSVTLFFGKPQPELSLRDAGFGFDPSGVVRTVVHELYGEAFRKAAFAKPGYDWTTDPNLTDNITRFIDSVIDPFQPRGPFTENLRLTSVSIHVMAAEERRGPRESRFQAVLHAQSSIHITVDFQAMFSNLLDVAKSSRLASSGSIFARRVKPEPITNVMFLNNITMNCSLGVFIENEEVGRVEKVELTSDARILLHEFTIIQPTVNEIDTTIDGVVVGLDVFVNLIVGGAKLLQLLGTSTSTAELQLVGNKTNQAVAEALGPAAQAARRDPEILKTEIRRILEPLLTEKIRQAIRENLGVIPGLDLTKVFDLPEPVQ